MVIRSKNLTKTSTGSRTEDNFSTTMRNPIIVRIKEIPKNPRACLKNLKVFGFGNKIVLINYPLIVLKELLRTKARIC